MDLDIIFSSVEEVERALEAHPELELDFERMRPLPGGLRSMFDTPLVSACREGDVEKARWLLRRGAAPSYLALGEATTRGFNMFEAFAEAGLDLDPQVVGDEVPHYPLRHAVREGWMDLCRDLLDRGVSVEGPGVADIPTPLQEAANLGHLDIALELLTRGAQVDAGPYASPLAIALFCGYLDLARLCLAHGADPCKVSQNGKSTFDFAESGGNLECIGWIYSHVRNSFNDEQKEKLKVSYLDGRYPVDMTKPNNLYSILETPGLVEQYIPETPCINLHPVVLMEKLQKEQPSVLFRETMTDTLQRMELAGEQATVLQLCVHRGENDHALILVGEAWRLPPEEREIYLHWEYHFNDYQKCTNTFSWSAFKKALTKRNEPMICELLKVVRIPTKYTPETVPEDFTYINSLPELVYAIVYAPKFADLIRESCLPKLTRLQAERCIYEILTLVDGEESLAKFIEYYEADCLRVVVEEFNNYERRRLETKPRLAKMFRELIVKHGVRAPNFEFLLQEE